MAYSSLTGGGDVLLTNCCEARIDDKETTCPGCGTKVVGWNVKGVAERGRMRRVYANNPHR